MIHIINHVTNLLNHVIHIINHVTYFLVGIVFNEDIDDDPLYNVTIKIRMNSTYVHDTSVVKER